MCELKNKSEKQKCQCKNINGLEADDLIIEKIRELVNPTSLFYQSLKKISKNTFTEEYKNNEELKVLRSSLSKNEKDINSLLDKIKYWIVNIFLDNFHKDIFNL